jgi:DNA-directed RNA polymerase sigma subunit (sigma70/sigma32)
MEIGIDVHPREARRAEMRRLREKSVSLRKIGEQFGISGERVRQILAQGETRPWGRTKKEAAPE